MRKNLAAFCIGMVCLAVLGGHAWWTWGDIDQLPPASASDRELFEYSLFLESFAFMLTAAYFAGPRIYRWFGAEVAAGLFEGEKGRVSRTVEIYAAVAVVIRRIGLDPRMGVPRSETIIAIVLICLPLAWTLLRSRRPGIRQPEADDGPTPR